MRMHRLSIALLAAWAAGIAVLILGRLAELVPGPIAPPLLVPAVLASIGAVLYFDVWGIYVRPDYSKADTLGLVSAGFLVCIAALRLDWRLELSLVTAGAAVWSAAYHSDGQDTPEPVGYGFLHRFFALWVLLAGVMLATLPGHMIDEQVGVATVGFMLALSVPNPSPVVWFIMDRFPFFKIRKRAKKRLYPAGHALRS